MAKHRLTIEVDGGELFDTLKTCGLQQEDVLRNIGERVVGSMMTGERVWTDDVGLMLYGIKITSIEKLDATEE
jgi:hypothetical protein